LLKFKVRKYIFGMFFFLSRKNSYQNKYLVRSKVSIETKTYPHAETVKIFIKNSEEFISLDNVAFDIWKLLEKKILFEDLIKRLADLYDVSKNKLIADVNKFIIELEKYHLIKISDC